MFAIKAKRRFDAVTNYFKQATITKHVRRTIPNYEDFVKNTIIPLLRSYGSLYAVELSNLEAICTGKAEQGLMSSRQVSSMPAERRYRLILQVCIGISCWD
ncbi:MAG: hypothetical protein P4M11_13195 [Candidatus Pacebacteria bacterium]|nr:hypothetical protein [Candidatus Paceibacterota bacterium]